MAREHEVDYRNLVHSLNTPIYTTDTEGRITLYNESSVTLWGREPELGKDRWCGAVRILNPDGTVLPFEQCPMAVCVKEGRPVLNAEIIVVRPDGEKRCVAVHPQPMLDLSGKMVGAVNMMVDITDTRHTEEALRTSERKYRDLALSLEKMVAEKTADLKQKNEELLKSEERYHRMVAEVEDYAIIFMDRNGIIQNWNKGAEKIKGYKDYEIIGRSFEVFYLEEDRQRGLPKQLIAAAVEQGKAIHEGWRRRKDGSRFWGSIVITALHDDENRIIGFTKVTRDLTARKMAEDTLKEYSSELEIQNRELEQFAYAASHDMKEPLRKIHFYNSFIADNPANTLDEKSREYLHRSVRSVHQLSRLIENLLTYSKTTSLLESFEEVDLGEIMRSIVAEHKEDFSEKGIEVEVGPLPVIAAIPFQCKQLFENLIGNAIKYQRPDHRGLIRVVSELVTGDRLPEKDAPPGREYHRISVIDNGIGFEPEHAERIFEMFQRLDYLPGAKGSGIGLAICRKIVQNHKGYIRAEGTLNEGARFEVCLPADPASVKVAE